MVNASCTIVSSLVWLRCNITKSSMVTPFVLQSVHTEMWSLIADPILVCSFTRFSKVRLVYPTYFISGSPRHVNSYTTLDSMCLGGRSFNTKLSITFLVLYIIRTSCPLFSNNCFMFLPNALDIFPTYGIFIQFLVVSFIVLFAPSFSSVLLTCSFSQSTNFVFKSFALRYKIFDLFES